MTSALETGYFIWNFSAWLKIFLRPQEPSPSSGIIKKKDRRESRDQQDDARLLWRGLHGFFEQKVSSFRIKVMQPWFDFPFSHILSIAVLFLLFAVALFQKSGVE